VQLINLEIEPSPVPTTSGAFAANRTTRRQPASLPGGWLLARFGLLVLLGLLGCDSSNRLASEGEVAAGGRRLPGISDPFPIQAGRYTILDIRTDNKNDAAAKANAEAALQAHPDMACMVGLWAYNPPMILSALRAVGLEGKVKVVGFDEADGTLQGISQGYVHGTVAQQPYLFGFKSVEYLAAIARGQPVDIPPGKQIFIPHEVIRGDNIQAFNARVAAMRRGDGPVPDLDRDDYKFEPPVKLCFITNSIDPFWSLAEEGVKRANPIFNVDCEVYKPSNATVEEQKSKIESLIVNRFQGLAVSPINPDNQVEMIDRAAEVMPVICQDSDAPNSQRLFYIGTSNYMAGRAVGQLIKEAIPEGGKVMLFVGKLEVLNAQERSRGLIDELMERPLPPAFASEPAATVEP
jgi:ribose transport system substrate-binding protein